MLSKTKSYADIAPEIRERVLERLGGEMPRSANGHFKHVYHIERQGTWHFRAAVKIGGFVQDYGTWCDEMLAAFVANYAKVYPVKTREQCWEDLGVVNLDALPQEFCESA